MESERLGADEHAERVIAQGILGSRFPREFVWGAATSAYQIEGAAREGGRGASIWDVFSHEPGRTTRGDTGDVACDHYHRLESDLDLMASLGLRAYRFSIAWPRIQPAGRGPANPQGLDFYRRLVDGLLARDIEPMATLYHWDLPQGLQDEGGWPARDTAARFADYATVVGEALGDRVRRWVTVNEPWVAAWLGYGVGLHAPGIADLASAARAHHHLLLGHGLATQALRAVLPAGRELGLALNMARVDAASDHPDDVAAAAVADAQMNRSFADPVFGRGYPREIGPFSATWAADDGPVLDGDLATIATSIDFLGVNTYHPRMVAARERVAAGRRGDVLGRSDEAMSFGMPIADVDRPSVPTSSMGWPIVPEAMTDLLLRIARDYDVPVFITENGAAAHDYVPPEGAIADDDRIAYLDGHVAAVAAALEAGADVRGYFVWSLFDNFEWSFGYSERFGIVYVDYPTSTRIPKASALWYRDLIAAARWRPGSEIHASARAED
ncbi:MAG TPA: GH1 family beta-glucosidase [Solirubrobacteraceae bacterium]|nr:GH1 family beta-glucosidase [Solirubrobacteraceae bacterium]